MSFAAGDADAIVAELRGLSNLDGFVLTVRAMLPRAIEAKLPTAGGIARQRMEADFRAIVGLPEPERQQALDVWFGVARSKLEAPVANRLDGLRTTFGTVVRPPGLDGRRVPEKIVLRDEMVDYPWLLAGHVAGKAVGYLEVPRIFGTARHDPSTGTGFLLDATHLLTAYHVIEARNRNAFPPEAPPSAAELEAQLAGTLVYFDYLEARAKGGAVAVSRLVASDLAIDYAVLELATPQPALGCVRLSTAPLPAVTADDGFAVNIIQHPAGKPKRIAIRNNAVAEVSPDELLYFTDTEGGSSGAPVFDDGWHVIAIHRGFEWRDKLRYMGREIGFANAGTRIGRILDHLATAAPELHGRLRARPA